MGRVVVGMWLKLGVELHELLEIFGASGFEGIASFIQGRASTARSQRQENVSLIQRCPPRTSTRSFHKMKWICHP